MRTILFALILAAPVVAQDMTPEEIRANNTEATKQYEADVKALRAEYDAVMKTAPKKEKDRKKPAWALKEMMAAFHLDHGSLHAYIRYLRKWQPRTPGIERKADEALDQAKYLTAQVDAILKGLPPPEKPRQRAPRDRQVTCYSETLPGPNGGTVQTRCY